MSIHTLTPALTRTDTRALTPLQGLRYGAIAAPLAFAALPLYVLLPNHYSARLGVPLAGLGLVLLATRALDAMVDPWLGRQVDRCFGRGGRRPLWLASGAAALLAIGMAALFFPPVRAPLLAPAWLLAWCAGALLITCLGYSVLGVLHQAWGARLGGDGPAQARIMGWREGCALVGVLLASVLPAVAGIGAMVATCSVGLVLGLLALRRAPSGGSPVAPVVVPDVVPDVVPVVVPAHASLAVPVLEPPLTPSARAARDSSPWHQPDFRRLLAVYLLNGVASAIPATLVIFFVRDRLQAQAFEALFLGSYFLAGALSMPLWLRLTRRIGLVRTWLAGMTMAVVSFAWAGALGPGDTLAFTVVCLASGAALGADLLAPAALLTAVIQRAGHAQALEGRYAGWWTCATKLNLALAAGAALPALQWWGYLPGSTDPAALHALALCYALLPCALKTTAALTLWRVRNELDAKPLEVFHP